MAKRKDLSFSGANLLFRQLPEKINRGKEKKPPEGSFFFIQKESSMGRFQVLRKKRPLY
jgi:hypothetical protein